MNILHRCVFARQVWCSCINSTCRVCDGVPQHYESPQISLHITTVSDGLDLLKEDTELHKALLSTASQIYRQDCHPRGLQGVIECLRRNEGLEVQKTVLVAR